MSGYYDQEPVDKLYTHNINEPGSVSLVAAHCLLEQAIACPDGPFTGFLRDAVENGWKVDLYRQGTLIPGYDDLVGKMNAHLESDSEPRQLFGKIIAHTVGIDLVGDGR